MNKKRGQALVEFVVILPIFIFFLFAMIDFGKMIFIKNQLESEMDEVIEEYKNELSFGKMIKRHDWKWKEKMNTFILF